MIFSESLSFLRLRSTSLVQVHGYLASPPVPQADSRPLCFAGTSSDVRSLPSAGLALAMSVSTYLPLWPALHVLPFLHLDVDKYFFTMKNDEKEDKFF